MQIIYEPEGRAAEYAHLSLNHYDGCDHGCSYCYVPGALRRDRESFHSEVRPKADVLSRVEKDAGRLKGTDKRVLLCFACDPYPDVETHLYLTRDVLRILNKYDVPFQVLTKSGVMPQRDFDLYRPGVDAFAVSLTALDAAVAAKVEPGASPPALRIDNLIEAKRRGIETWVSLEPVLDPKEAYRIITVTHEYVDLYKIGPRNHAKSNVTDREWQSFAERVKRLYLGCGCKYYFKLDLVKHLGDMAYYNTDNRCAARDKGEMK